MYDLDDNLLFQSNFPEANTDSYNRDTDPDITGFTDFSAASDAAGQIIMVTGPWPAGGRTISHFNGLAIVPEPSTAFLLMTGLLGLVFIRRRRRARGR